MLTIEGFGSPASLRAVVAQGLVFFKDAKEECPAMRAAGGMDMQMDWVHVPDDEDKPWGTWCEEWEQADARAFNDAAQYLRRVVKNKTGAKTWIDDLDAELPGPFSLLIPGTTKLLKAYDAATKIAPPEPRRLKKWPGIVAGASALGVGLIATVWRTYRP